MSSAQEIQRIHLFHEMNFIYRLIDNFQFVNVEEKRSQKYVKHRLLYKHRTSINEQTIYYCRENLIARR